MKLETSEKERNSWKGAAGHPECLLQRLLRDIDALLAEVERLRAEYELAGEQINELETEAEASAAEIGRLRTERRPFSDGLAQKVIDEQVKTIDRLTAKLATPPTPPLPAEVERIAQRLSDLVERAPDDDVLVFHRGLIAVAASLLSRWPGVWRPIETAPKMKTIMLFAVTDRGEDGLVKNWKMATGFWHNGFADHHDMSPWEWNGRQLAKYDVQPTHWMPIPEPPNE